MLSICCSPLEAGADSLDSRIKQCRTDGVRHNGVDWLTLKTVLRLELTHLAPFDDQADSPDCRSMRRRIDEVLDARMAYVTM